MGCCLNKRILLFIGIGVIVLFGLAYVFQWDIILRLTPFLIFLLCPLMHVVMMGLHGRHEQGQKPGTKNDKSGSCH